MRQPVWNRRMVPAIVAVAAITNVGVLAQVDAEISQKPAVLVEDPGVPYPQAAVDPIWYDTQGNPVPYNGGGKIPLDLAVQGNEWAYPAADKAYYNQQPYFWGTPQQVPGPLYGGGDWYYADQSNPSGVVMAPEGFQGAPMQGGIGMGAGSAVEVPAGQGQPLIYGQQPVYPAGADGGWYSPMDVSFGASRDVVESDWNYPNQGVPIGGAGGAVAVPEYPNQWYNMDPYGPVPGYGQDPCAYLYESYYDDCSGDSGMFVPRCDVSVCIESCKKHFGFEQGSCFNNECFCKKEQVDWSYENQDDWYLKYPNCRRPQQSPIDIDSSTLRDLSRKLFFEHYTANFSFFTENTGHGVRHLVQTSVMPAVQVAADLDVDGSPIKRGTYILGFIDLHWDQTEHSLSGRKGHLEAQLNHFDSSYPSYADAVEGAEKYGDESALLSIALGFQLDDFESDLKDSMFPSAIREPDGVGVIVGPDTYLEFITQRMGKMYGVYRGSLSYPPCTPAVNWLVSAEIYRVTQWQIDQLQKLQDKLGKPILSNTRRIQSTA